MPDFDVVALIKAKPGSQALVGEALTGLVEPTRAEPGCLSYTLSVSREDPTVFVTIERWKSQDDLDAHMQTDHVKAALGAAGEHLEGSPEIHPLTLLG